MMINYEWCECPNCEGSVGVAGGNYEDKKVHCPICHIDFKVED